MDDTVDVPAAPAKATRLKPSFAMHALAMCAMTIALLAFVVYPMFRADSPVDAQTYEDLTELMSAYECPPAQATALSATHDGSVNGREAKMLRSHLSRCRMEHARSLFVSAIWRSSKQSRP